MEQWVSLKDGFEFDIATPKMCFNPNMEYEGIKGFLDLFGWLTEFCSFYALSFISVYNSSQIIVFIL